MKKEDVEISETPLYGRYGNEENVRIGTLAIIYSHGKDELENAVQSYINHVDEYSDYANFTVLKTENPNTKVVISGWRFFDFEPFENQRLCEFNPEDDIRKTHMWFYVRLDPKTTNLPYDIHICDSTPYEDEDKRDILYVDVGLDRFAIRVSENPEKLTKYGDDIDFSPVFDYIKTNLELIKKLGWGEIGHDDYWARQKPVKQGKKQKQL